MFPYLFTIEDEESDEEGEGQDGKDEDGNGDESNQGIQGFAKRWLWVDWCVRVREIYGGTLPEIYRMNIIEYFNYICYIKEKQELEKAEINKIKNKRR